MDISNDYVRAQGIGVRYAGDREGYIYKKKPGLKTAGNWLCHLKTGLTQKMVEALPEELRGDLKCHVHVLKRSCLPVREGVHHRCQPIGLQELSESVYRRLWNGYITSPSRRGSSQELLPTFSRISGSRALRVVGKRKFRSS